MKESRTLNRAVAAILTAAFLGFVLTAFVVMVTGHFQDLRKSIQLTDEKLALLPDSANPLERLSGRINGFTAEIADDMWLKRELGYVNSAFQYALGKRMINTGSQNMVKLNTGHLYDLNPYKDLSKNVADIIEQRETVMKDYPFLFVYEHPTLYSDDMMPAGYDALDASARMADEAVAGLRAGGVEVLDSRDVLPDCGIPLDELLMVTDQHWSTLAAITMGQAVAGELNAMTGAKLDPSLLDLDRLDTEKHERLFIGKYGQRLGPKLVTPDDITEYWPKASDAQIHRVTRHVTRVVDVSGGFRDAVTRFEVLETPAGQSWNETAYMLYGLTESYSIFTNDSAPDYTILLLKDSYGAPIGTFLSLLAHNVVCVDLRQDVDPLETWLEKYHPDAVVMAYSLQMLRDDNYAFE